MTDLPQLLASGDLLVFNDTRELPARLLARKPTGGRVEVLLERALPNRRALVRPTAPAANRCVPGVCSKPQGAWVRLLHGGRSPSGKSSCRRKTVAFF